MINIEVLQLSLERELPSLELKRAGTKGETSQRICMICKDNNFNVVEDEKHVLIHCPGYADMHSNFFLNIYNNENFISMSDDGQFFLFHDEYICFHTAKFCQEILFRRRCLLYSKPYIVLNFFKELKFILTVSHNSFQSGSLCYCVCIYCSYFIVHIEVRL